MTTEKEFTINNKTKGILWYLVIAFAITWSSVLGIYLLGGVSSSALDVTSASPLVGLLGMLGTFGPAIAAFVVRKWITREGFKDAGLRLHFRAGWTIYLWAVIAPLAGGILTVVAAWATGAEVSGLSAISATDIVPWIIGALIWTPILFGEEFGWRGYLQPRLAPGRPLQAALRMGLIWGIWHYAQVLAGIVMSANPLALLIYPFSCITGSILLGWLRTKSQSVWPACLAHAVGNVIVTGAIGGLLPQVPDISTFAYRVIGYALVALALFLSHRVPWREAEATQVAAHA
ncbi:MAG: CPBP family intramembrane metalloprotease [Chloroflexi bacterium]|nr:CPBP family intramembrane metalloprotease [Chloroflexota bacterium]